jgi:glucose-6-phosphate isomerase
MWLDGPNIGIYSILLSSSEDEKINIPQSKFLPWSRSYSLDNLSNVMAHATYDSLKFKNRPVRMINIPSRNPESIASLMVIFLVEVLILAELKNINPYGQPAVEDIKVKTLNRLNK